jgi:hypothetical protein
MLRKSFCLSLLVIANTAFGYGSPVSQCLDFVSNHRTHVAVACGGAIMTTLLAIKGVKMYSTYQENCKKAERARQIAEAQRFMSDAPNRIEKIEAAAQASLQEDLSAKVNCSDSLLMVRNAYRGLTSEARGLSDGLSKAKELLATQGENVSIDNYVVRLTVCETSLQAKLTELFKQPDFQVAFQEELSQRIDNLSGRMGSVEYRVSQLQNSVSELKRCNSTDQRIFQLENTVRQLQSGQLYRG